MTKLYRLRPLEWVEHHFYRSAKTPWGEYRVHYDEIEGDFFWTDPGLLKFHKCQSYEDGQSAAEAHYHARMRGGLEEVEADDSINVLDTLCDMGHAGYVEQARKRLAERNRRRDAASRKEPTQ